MARSFSLVVTLLLTALALFIGSSRPASAVTDPIYTLPFFAQYMKTCGFGCYSGHLGTDYQLGDPSVGGEWVVAAADGTVFLTGYVKGPGQAGHYMEIDHSNGRQTRYLHLQSAPAVAFGPGVSRGQLLGYEGNSGSPWCQDPPACNDWQSPYHLHFETKINGTAVDPYPPANQLWSTDPPSYAEGESVGVTSWASNRLDVFVRGNNGQLYHKWWNGSQWNPVGSWEGGHGGCLLGGPAAVSRMANRIDVFVRWCDSTLYKRSWDGTQWLPWQPIPGSCLKSEPAVASWSSTRLDLFVRGCYDALHWNYSNNGGVSWAGWQPDLGGCLNAAPGAATWGGNHLAVFVRRCEDNTLHRNFYFGGPWSGFVGLGGCLGSGPGADSWAVNRLDVFIRGCSDFMWHNYSSNGGTTFSGFIEATGCITSGAGVTSRMYNFLDIFAAAVEETGICGRSPGPEALGRPGWTSVLGHDGCLLTDA